MTTVRVEYDPDEEFLVDRKKLTELQDMVAEMRDLHEALELELGQTIEKQHEIRRCRLRYQEALEYIQSQSGVVCKTDPTWAADVATMALSGEHWPPEGLRARGLLKEDGNDETS